MSANPRLLKVILLGDGGVGKSSIMNRFVHNKFDAHCYHTIGVEFLNKDVIVDGEKYTLQIWDTAGQERFRSLRTPFYRGSDMCILTFALNERASFQNLEMWRREFFYYGDVSDQESFPFLVLGNKCDVPEDQRQVNKEEVQNWCQMLAPGAKKPSNEVGDGRCAGSVVYLETSAKDAINVETGFVRAVQMWKDYDKRAQTALAKDRSGSLDGQPVRLQRGSKSAASRNRQRHREGCCS